MAKSKINESLIWTLPKGLFMEILGTSLTIRDPEAEILAELVIEGNWSFYADPISSVDLPNLPVKLGPGVCPDVRIERIEDDTIS